MLGEQIGEVTGKITSQRVLDTQPTLETSISASGKFRGTHVDELLTFTGRPTSHGVIHGVGKGDSVGCFWRKGNSHRRRDRKS